MVTRVLFGIAALLFAFAGLGVSVIQNPMIWGLFSLALAFFIGTLPQSRKS